MTISEMHTWFKLLIDKYKSPYFTDTEIDNFINRAQANYVNELVYGRNKTQEGVKVESSMENTTQWSMLLTPLIKYNIPVTSSSNSLLLYSAIKSGFSSDEILAILEVRDSRQGYEVIQIRHNDFGADKRNYFTRPDTDYRGYRITDTGLLLEPISVGEPFLVSVIRTPRVVNKATTTSCELPKATHEKILAMAVDLAKITTEDEALGVVSGQTV
jgi:hypothetical protein